ncbi:hypothetical protein [Massilia sp. TN1-12]
MFLIGLSMLASLIRHAIPDGMAESDFRPAAYARDGEGAHP